MYKITIEKLKEMSYGELDSLAKEIREYMISVISKNGGHLASNLGVVELTLALYRVFNPYEDYIIWDTGHQTYVHKLLTDRWEQFPTIRTFGGLSGFTNLSEHFVDRFGTGHVGTSIAAALGIEKALKLSGKRANVVVIIGDGALTSGQALESLNQIHSQNSKIKIILNSNGMSIAPNVGGISNILNALRTSKIYLKLKETVKVGLDQYAELELRKFRESIKGALIGEDIFEALGLKHFGPVDGHDIPFLEKALKMIKDYPYPAVFTVFTIKGKGFSYSEDNPVSFHSAEKFDPDTGIFDKPKNSINYSEIVGKTLVEIGKNNDKVIVLTAAMPDGTGTNYFQKEFPNRFVDLGITEQSVVTYAGGLATLGYKPVVAIYSTFLQRAYDQIIHDIALQNLDVFFVIDRAGIVGTDGPTHHGVFDIAYLRSIPNMKILTPIDAHDLANILYSCIGQLKGPTACRYPRGYEFGNFEEIYGKIEKVDPFKWVVLNKGEKIALFAVGTLAKKYLEICKKNNWTLVAVRSVKPLDLETLFDSIQNVEIVATAEDGVIYGGFGESIYRYLAGKKIINFGIEDIFVAHGKREELMKSVKLDPDSIEKHLKEFLSKEVENL